MSVRTLLARLIKAQGHTDMGYELPPEEAAPDIDGFGEACPGCNGDGVPMGTMGRLEWLRCRQCGMEWSRMAAQVRRRRRGGYEPDPDEFPADAYSVANYPGVAWYVLGWETEPDEDTEWSGSENRTGKVIAVMVGDDRHFTFDPEDLIPLDREAYCGECGQIGCSHDGLERAGHRAQVDDWGLASDDGGQPASDSPDAGVSTSEIVDLPRPKAMRRRAYEATDDGDPCDHPRMDGDTCAECGESCTWKRGDGSDSDRHGWCVDTECPIHGDGGLPRPKAMRRQAYEATPVPTPEGLAFQRGAQRRPAKTRRIKSDWGQATITVSTQCPTQSIDYIVDKLHVGTPDAEIEANIRKRSEGRANWTPELIDEAVRYALWKHGENRAEYRGVMGGGWGYTGSAEADIVSTSEIVDLPRRRQGAMADHRDDLREALGLI